MSKPIQFIYLEERQARFNDAMTKLEYLLDKLADVTGKEDLIYSVKILKSSEDDLIKGTELNFQPDEKWEREYNHKLKQESEERKFIMELDITDILRRHIHGMLVEYVKEYKTGLAYIYLIMNTVTKDILCGEKVNMFYGVSVAIDESLDFGKVKITK